MSHGVVLVNLLIISVSLQLGYLPFSVVIFTVARTRKSIVPLHLTKNKESHKTFFNHVVLEKEFSRGIKLITMTCRRRLFARFSE